MSELEREWPDDDRREAALHRLREATEGRRHRNGQHHRRLNGGRSIALEPTPHELRVVQCLSYGLGNQGAADVLGLSYEAVKSSARLARQRVAAKNTSHLVAICLRHGWIE